jgi:hypothetical protein
VRDLFDREPLGSVRIGAEQLQVTLLAQAAEHGDGLGKGVQRRPFEQDDPAALGDQGPHVLLSLPPFLSVRSGAVPRCRRVLRLAEQVVKVGSRVVQRSEHFVGDRYWQPADVDQRPGQAEPPQVGLVIDSLVRASPLALRNQSLPHVVLNGGNGHPAASAQLGYPHSERPFSNSPLRRARHPYCFLAGPEFEVLTK